MSKKRSEDLIQAIKEKGKNIEAEMSFFDHLDVLRGHLIRSAIAICIFATLAWCYYDFIYNEVILGPKHTGFWTYRMMCLLSKNFPSLFSDFCVTKINFELINTEMAGQFTLQMNSSLMIGVIFGIPYLLFELWRFIKPGLNETEQKSTTGFVFFASALFLLGILFGYYIITPMSINFLAGFVVSSDIKNMIEIDSYMSSVATLTIGTGIVFELPVVIFVLSKMGLMTPKFMRSSRRYAIVIILIIAAVVTPTPDILTMMVVSFPLFILYEFSITISGMVERSKKKAELEFYKR
ncbi:twin-arginine translocase subunit TatC [Hufsiella ginkgonis]|uniref:Sec-independent protein translocase protein TatC n=1 Tax=Hufsiella ginkgonis TaxID=2695274 RepID=A0A7K1Y1K8_9SPHI|nr:twin-arginine translocase subunit TatC [Hufsiella ginkgonis]MXV16968.1 twin-arginine translocase subunit TatC [Hufsiella ginkgonis]